MINLINILQKIKKEEFAVYNKFCRNGHTKQKI